MKRLIMILAVVLGITPNIAPIPTLNSAMAGTVVASPMLREVPGLKSLSNSEVFEINFIVRTFLWALDQSQAGVLAKIAAPQMRAEFPGPIVMLNVMRRVHAPVIGARQVFLHLPTYKNGMVLQSVYLGDAKGNPWKTTYMLRRNNDGHFGVIGCVVTKLAGEFS